MSVCVLLCLPLLAQAPSKVPADLRFDVASFKPSTAQAPGGGIRPAPGGQRYVATNCPIRLMMQVAYRVKAEQILGGPGWLDTDRYDMDAKAEKPSTADELHVMLINLLMDRLQMKLHHETKEMPRYALTLAPGGPKMTPHAAANAGEPWIDQVTEKFLHLRLKATTVSMDYVAFRLSQLLDRPVVDQTNLPGGYDFDLTYTRELPPGFPENGKINGEDPDTSGPTIFEALKRQLGLELKSQKGPLDVIVIDRAERPAAN